jgi:hypothetical protein
VAELAGVRGVAETTRALKGLGVAAADLKAAHQKVAELITPIAASRSRHRTGALASSWTPAAVAGSARIRSTLPYAGPMEYGWPARGIPARRAVIGAVVDNEAAVLDVYEVELGRIIARLE